MIQNCSFPSHSRCSCRNGAAAGHQFNGGIHPFHHLGPFHWPGGRILSAVLWPICQGPIHFISQVPEFDIVGFPYSRSLFSDHSSRYRTGSCSIPQDYVRHPRRVSPGLPPSSHLSRPCGSIPQNSSVPIWFVSTAKPGQLRTFGLFLWVRSHPPNYNRTQNFLG